MSRTSARSRFVLSDRRVSKPAPGGGSGAVNPMNPQRPLPPPARPETTSVKETRADVFQSVFNLWTAPPP